MKIFVLVCLVTVVSSTPVDTEKYITPKLEECTSAQNPALCLKEVAFDLLLRVDNSRTLKIFDGVTFINNGQRKSRSLEPLSTDPEQKDKQLTDRLWKSTSELIEQGDVEITFGANSDDDEAESRAINEVDEGRGKKKKLKKKLKILIPLLILAKVKAVALAVIALLIIAFSVLKLAVIAKLAFIIKIIALIKALIAAKKHHQEETTYEIAPAHGWEPHGETHTHIEHGHGWEGGWQRSRNEGSNLAYSAYAN